MEKHRHSNRNVCCVQLVNKMCVKSPSMHTHVGVQCFSGSNSFQKIIGMT